MKCVHLILASALFGLAESALAQGFVNLDFESANIPNETSPGSLTPIANGFPGWTGYFVSGNTTNTTLQVAYDGISLGGAEISINDVNTGNGFAQLQGNFSAYLFGAPGLGSAAISQTGLIPTGTQSLLVDIQQSSSPFNVPFTASLNGVAINLAPIEVFADYTVYGGNISSYAGTVSTLAFINPPPTKFPPSALLLDDIQFSSSAIPEPGEFSLLMLGVLSLGFCRFRKSTRRNLNALCEG